VLRNLLRKSKFHQNPTRIKGTSHEDLYTLMIISRSVLLRMRNASDKTVEKIKTYILYPVTLFENLAVNELMRKKYGRARQATDDNMEHALCMLDN
jgi:D-alanyl-D-alanine dipeptidase